MRNKVPRQCGHVTRPRLLDPPPQQGHVLPRDCQGWLRASEGKSGNSHSSHPLIREAVHTLHPLREGFASHCLPRLELIISYCFRPKISEDEGIPADPLISSWFVLTRPQSQNLAIFLGSHQP